MKRLQTADKEAADREGYRGRSQDRDELAAWGKRRHGRRAARLDESRMRDVCSALAFALGCDG